MQAYELIIDAKVKASPFGIVSADDFETHDESHLDPNIILEQTNFSLYCLDHTNRQALFVETSPDVDLLQSPFYFIAQYDAAQRLIAVPYETLHALACKVVLDQRKVILFYSTGHCGSTLFSHILNLNTAVVSFSEPDVFSQLVMLHTAGQSSDDETASLLWDSIMIMSANAQQQGFQYFAFKFRSYVLSVSALLYRAMPDAKIIFMYRNALTWAYSFSRAFGAATDNGSKERLTQSGFRYMIPSVNEYLKIHSEISWVEYIAHMWVSTMQESCWLQQKGAALACARFEDLKTNPHEVIQSLLAHCGLPLPDPDQLAVVLARDSQAGTAGAQDRQDIARLLTDADLSELDTIIRELDPKLAPDTILS